MSQVFNSARASMQPIGLSSPGGKSFHFLKSEIKWQDLLTMVYPPPDGSLTTLSGSLEGQDSMYSSVKRGDCDED